MTTPHTPLTDADFAALVEAMEGEPGPQCITCLDTGHYTMADGGHFCSCVCGPIAETYSKSRRAALRREDTLRAQLAQARAEVERLREAEDGIGKWLSAALDDPNVCDAMKMDIRAWFDACATLTNPDVVTGGE